MLAELWAAIKVLPAVVVALESLVKYLKEAFGDNPRKFIKDAGQAFKELSEAKSGVEKQKAAAAIADLIARL